MFSAKLPCPIAVDTLPVLSLTNLLQNTFCKPFLCQCSFGTRYIPACFPLLVSHSRRWQSEQKRNPPRREDFSKARRLASFALIDHYSCPASLACSVPRYAFCIPRCPTRENTFVVTGDGFHAILSGNASNGWLSRLALLPATQGLPDAARVSVGLAGLQAQNAKSPLSQFPLESLGRRSSERRLATKSENRLRGLLIMLMFMVVYLLSGRLTPDTGSLSHIHIHVNHFLLFAYVSSGGIQIPSISPGSMHSIRCVVYAGIAR